MTNLQDIREKKTPITIGDKTYNLFYDLNAFAELEEIYGTIDKAMLNLVKGSVKSIRAILWAGLIHENENLTQKEVGKLVDLSQFDQIGDVIEQAVSAAVPQNNNEGIKKK